MSSPAIFLVVLMGLTASPQDAQEAYQNSTKPIKIPVRYARASDISLALGGGVLDGPSGRQREYYAGGDAQALLPMGIDAIFADDRDNTLVARGDKDAMRELRELVKMLDIAPRPVDVRAVAFLTVTDNAGRKHRLELRAEGRTSGERRLHLRTSAEGDTARLAGAVLAAQTSDLDIHARPVGEGSISLDADWYVDIAWRVSGSAKPLRLRNTFRTSAVVESGGTATVTRATLKLPSGTAELELQLTPRLPKR